MRIWHFGGHEELEILIKIDIGLSKSNLGDSSFRLELLLLENWIDSWVNSFLQVFNKYRSANSNGVTNLSQESVSTKFHE